MIDIDNFKAINDSSGHQAGDAVLTAVVARLLAASRSIDLLARYGGDEFVLFLPDTPAIGASLHAEQMRRTVEENERVTISIGLCVVSAPDDLDDPTLLLARADEALYVAKRAGRNRVEVWGTSAATPDGVTGPGVTPSSWTV